MKRLFNLGPWLVELINPPPRASLSLLQKGGRMLLVTVTIITLCIIVAGAGSLGCFAWQRSREFLEGAPQVRNGLLIVASSLVVNAGCVYALIQIKRMDRRLVPRPPERLASRAPDDARRSRGGKPPS